MNLSWYPFQLQFKHPFVLAHGTRSATAVVFVEISHDGHIGYGEAALPPYLPETQESVIAFLQKINCENIPADFEVAQVVDYIDSIAEGNNTAKAAVDIALHDLWGKLNNVSLYNHWLLANKPFPPATFTIGIGNAASIVQKLKEGEDFKLYKLKLGGINDREMITTFKAATNKPFCVDVNQGWTDKTQALDEIYWLHSMGAILVEQPLPKQCWDETAWITEHSPLPIIADESVRRLADIELANGAYSGINVKLAKSTGLIEAHKMIIRARELNMKVLVGCMSESSCAVTAAAHLAPLCDWADIDGPYLINNDPFKGMEIIKGNITLKATTGLSFMKR